MLNSIAFAKWFLNKHRQSGIFVDSNDFQFVISQLDQSSWDEFNQSNDSIGVAKSTADALIPQLVDKMPKNTRIKKNTENTRKKKQPGDSIQQKFRVDASTSTGEQSIHHVDSVFDSDVNTTNSSAKKEQPVAVAEQEPAGLPQKKKRGQKAKTIPLEKEPESNIEIANIVAEQEPAVLPEKKKRGPNAKKNIPLEKEPESNAETANIVAEQEQVGLLVEKESESNVETANIVVEKESESNVETANIVVEKEPESNVETANIVAEQEPAGLPEKKKRGPKAKTIPSEKELESNAETANIVAGSLPEKKKRGQKAKTIQVESEKESVVTHEKKKRGPKKNAEVEEDEVYSNEEVVVPVQEELQLQIILENKDEGELIEEQFDGEEEESVDLIEHFVDEVLYYVDVNGNWFDSNLNRVETPK